VNGPKKTEGERTSVRVPSDLRFIEPVRLFLEAIVGRLVQEGAAAELHNQTVSAFNEGFTNAVIHGQGETPNQTVDVELTVDHEGLTLSIADGGRGFDLNQVPPPNLAELPEQGLGLWIIRSTMDEVSYRQQPGRNVLTMIKRFAHPRADNAQTERGEKGEPC
jgi:serine/threonine-protein kinase RsbW